MATELFGGLEELAVAVKAAEKVDPGNRMDSNGTSAMVTQQSLTIVSGGDSFEEYPSDLATYRIGRFDADRLRHKTMSFMLSLFKSYGCFMQDPGANVLGSKASQEMSTVPETATTEGAATRAAPSPPRARQQKKKKFDTAGFLADTQEDECKFLERFVGTSDPGRGGNTGTQIWSMFVQERERQEIESRDVFAEASLLTMGKLLETFELYRFMDSTEQLWGLPEKWQRRLSRTVSPSRRNRPSMAGQSLSTRPSFDLSPHSSFDLEAGAGLAPLTPAQSKKNRELTKQWRLLDFTLSQTRLKSKKIGAVEGGTSCIHDIDVSSSAGYSLRIPTADRQAGRLYKTPYVFEIVRSHANGGNITLCAQSREQRRLWVRFLDARRRTVDVTELRAAYLPPRIEQPEQEPDQQPEQQSEQRPEQPERPEQTEQTEQTEDGATAEEVPAETVPAREAGDAATGGETKSEDQREAAASNGSTQSGTMWRGETMRQQTKMRDSRRVNAWARQNLPRVWRAFGGVEDDAGYYEPSDGAGGAAGSPGGRDGGGGGGGGGGEGGTQPQKKKKKKPGVLTRLYRRLSSSPSGDGDTGK